MKGSGGGGSSWSPPAAAAVPRAAGGSALPAAQGLIRRERAAALPRRRDGANSGNRAGLSRARGRPPSGSRGRALPGAEHGAGRRGAAKAAPSPRCPCLSVRLVCVSVPGSALATGAATAPVPRPIAAGSCRLRGRRRPLTPGSAHKRRERGKGEESGREAGAALPAPLPCPPGDGLAPAEPQRPPRLRFPGRGERPGPPGQREEPVPHLSRTENFSWGKVAEQ